MSSPTVLAKGANAAVTSPAVLVTLSWRGGSTLDLSGLLVGASGKVRDDADFVFYNQPAHASGAVTHRGAGPGSDALSVDLALLPSEVERVVLAASADTGTFGALTHLELVVSDAATGEDLLRFADMGASTETAFVAGELYRRDGSWKFRAVGQGWDSGLAGLAGAYGISVEEPAAPARAMPEVPPPPPPGSAPHGPVPPPPPGVATPPPPPSPGQSAVSAPVNLDKGRVSLVKHQVVSLTKSAGPALDDVTLGLGWDPAPGRRAIDLDASVITYAADGKPLELVYFGRQAAYNGAILHSGDNLTGEGEGDDEQIRVRLSAIPPQVHHLVFTITSYNGQRFTEVQRAFCRLLDDSAGGRGAEMVRYDLTDSEPRTAVIMAVISRDGPAWQMKALGTYADGKTARKLVAPAWAAVRG